MISIIGDDDPQENLEKNGTMNGHSFLPAESIDNDCIVELINSSKKLIAQGVFITEAYPGMGQELIHLRKQDAYHAFVKLEIHRSHLSLHANGVADPYCDLGWSKEDGIESQSQYDSMLVDFMNWINDAMVGTKMYVDIMHASDPHYHSGHKYFLCREITTTYGLLKENLEEDILSFFDDLELFNTNYPWNLEE